MIPGANMMPMMMMMAGLTATATVGKDVAFRVIDTVKSAIVQYELGGIRDTLVQEHVYGGIEDLIDDDEAFREHLEESMQSKGGRDVSLDLWDMPYQLESAGEDRYVVYSTGPNTYEDGGCATTAMDRAKEWEQQITDWDVEKLAEEESEAFALPSDDDICIDFVVKKQYQVYQPLSRKPR
jgi:hypothetical protein